jgi:putative CocE/NonD family hydrolase
MFFVPRGSRLSHCLKVTMRVVLVVLFLASLSGASQTPPSKTYRIVWQFNVQVPMRDGVKLATDILRPDSAEQFPVILVRTPYGKGEEPPRDEMVYFAEHGYAVAVQDVRGRNDSGGDWIPFLNESNDGYDAQEWAAKQSWSNGEVVPYGASYLSFVQWLAARTLNPNLKAMVSNVGLSDFYETFHPGGAFLFGFASSWGTVIDGRIDQYQEIEFVPWTSLFQHLPVNSALSVAGRDPRFYWDWAMHPTYDSYWQQLRWDDRYKDFGFPVLNIGGWFDVFQRGTIENFQKVRSQGPARSRNAQMLIVGPWVHRSAATLHLSSQQGSVDFGPQSILDLREIILRWLDHYVKGLDNGIDKEPPVKVFTMGENAWHGYADWPVPGTIRSNYYLHSNGSANSTYGDGLLSTEPPGSHEPPDHYAYDPNYPVPTVGGANCCAPEIVPWGPMDQRVVEQRHDVLVYATPPLDEDIRVTGPLTMSLWIASSARDTDFTAKLVDIYPNGFAMNLADGITRAKYRKSFERFDLLEPGRPYQVTIDLGNTSNVFKKGHRVSLEISSSNFPRYSRNTNTGNQPEADTNWQTAQQTVLHDSQHASILIVPVIQ